MEIALIITTTVSSIAAAVIGLFAWRIAREERRRSAARVAALASDLQDMDGYRDQAAVGMRAQPARARAEPARFPSVASRSPDVDLLAMGRPRIAPDADLFRDVRAGRSRSTLATVFIVGGVAVATALALVVAAGRGGTTAAPAAPDSSQPATVADAAPLELIALSHDRDGNRLTVRGVVRNPSAGATIRQLTAVVFLFDSNGGFLESGRAAMRVPLLAPGAESSFVVSIDRAGGVGRYRVSFRSGNRVITHVDRRPAAPLAQIQ